MRRNFNAAGTSIDDLISETEKQCNYFKSKVSANKLEVAILTPTNKEPLPALDVAKVMEVITKHFADAEMDFDFGECQGNEYCVEVAW
ncbi:hypothetical protein MY04_1758 [Flammeovirga sp. MY04]|uniref:hypothetical protein n=1 Tax=Flammeovirga sp. MY04 TaxID=1191459 RepID=UPI0008064196|nr:hypothetical protein [Flammeovirga sp. MY04]ANQ49132.1 hypothetical protein MY04_1758 [Flammeovirga sp. MY04]